jgi:membrane-associated phospholipid phosphatase
MRTFVLRGCAALLILGLVARFYLAAHWPRDVIITSLIGLLWASFLVGLLKGEDKEISNCLAMMEVQVIRF